MHLMKDQQFVYYHKELTEVYMREQHVTCSLNVNSVVACLDSIIRVCNWGREMASWACFDMMFVE